jgi:hypothetical protein
MRDDLTNGMTRLSGEISALRQNRAAYRSRLKLGRVNLENRVSGLIAGFRRDREEMGERTKAEVAEFMSDLMGARAAWSGSAVKRVLPRFARAEH